MNSHSPLGIINNTSGVGRPFCFGEDDTSLGDHHLNNAGESAHYPTV